jgi:hypothetical protein
MVAQAVSPALPILDDFYHGLLDGCPSDVNPQLLHPRLRRRPFHSQTGDKNRTMVCALSRFDAMPLVKCFHRRGCAAQGDCTTIAP